MLAVLLLFLVVANGCARTRDAVPVGHPPAALTGTFADDYSVAYTISQSVWQQHPDNKYRVVAWYPEAGYLIAQNDEGNVSDGGLWTRIDWIPLEGMPPYTWAYCLSAYNAPTREAAAQTLVAEKETPRTGCNGFPFSRMKPAQANE